LVRPRPVLRSWLVLATLAAAFVWSATAAGQGDPPTPEAIERLPYRIKVLLAAEPAARFDAGRRAAFLRDWSDAVDRFVGEPWQVEVAGEAESAPLVLGGDLESADPARLEPFAGDVEKVWMVRLEAEGSGYALTGREYDASTRRLGPLHRRPVPVSGDLPRQFLRFALDLFSPFAEIGERFGKGAALAVRGAALTPASESGRVVRVGSVFQPFRVVPAKAGQDVVREIPYTYLRVDSVEGGAARSELVSMFSDPLTGRVLQKTRLVALGTNPGTRPTRLRFLTLPDGAPAAGYTLTARSLPDGPPREVGLTDRQGRITLPAGFSDGLEVLRLVAGGHEPLREFPLMPGEADAELVVPPFDPKERAVALESRLDSLRDEVIDLVAIRARLEARLKARFDGEDWPGAEEALVEFTALPRRETFSGELERLRDEAARRQAEENVPILTKTAQSRVAELQGLIERYLDDEAFRAYADALEKQKGPPPAAKKAP